MTPAPAMTFRRLRAALALSAAIVLFSVAVWIVVPAPLSFVLPLAVAAPELSAWLLAVSAIVAAAAAFEMRSGRVGRVALGLASITVALSLVPLVRAAAAIPRLDQAMRTGLGEHFADRIPAAVRARMRPSPIVVGDL